MKRIIAIILVAVSIVSIMYVAIAEEDIICPSCGERYPSDTDFLFCGKCGTKLSCSQKHNMIASPYESEKFLNDAMMMNSSEIKEGSTYAALIVSPLIPVEAGTYGLKVRHGDYNLGNIVNATSTSGAGDYGLYESDGVTPVAKSGTRTIVEDGIYLITIPEGVKFLRFGINKGAAPYFDEAIGWFNQWILLPGADESITEDFFTLTERKENGSTNKLYSVDDSNTQPTASNLMDKQILVFGDSIWGNDRTNGVSDFLKEYTGATIYNCSLGGTRITGDRNSYEGGPAWTAFDGVNLIHAKMTNTWTDQDTYQNQVTSYAPEVLTLLKSVDMTKIDVCILAYGRNDFTGARTISDITGALEMAIDEIQTAYPKIRFLICTVPWSMFDSTDGDVFTNYHGYTLRDLADAIIEKAKALHCDSLDVLERLPWRNLTKSIYLDGDNVHPSTEGNKVYAHVVNGKLNDMY